MTVSPDTSVSDGAGASQGGGGGSNTVYAWNPLTSAINNGFSNSTVLALSGIPSGFLEDGSDWSFAIRFAGSTYWQNVVTALFCSDVELGGIGVQTGADSISQTNAEITLSGMTDTNYNQTYTISTVAGTYNSFIPTVNTFNDDSNYRVYKYDAGGGTFYCIMFDRDLSNWDVFNLDEDPDGISDLDVLNITSTETVAGFSDTDDGVNIPQSADPNVTYVNGTDVYTNKFTQMDGSTTSLTMDTGQPIHPNCWLVFSFDSAAGTFNAWINEVKVNTGTSATFAASSPTTIHFGNETAGYTSAVFYNIVGVQVSSIMIMDDTLTDAEAGEFISTVNSSSSLTSGLQTKVTNAWTFNSSGVVTDVGAINLIPTNDGIDRHTFEEVLLL